MTRIFPASVIAGMLCMCMPLIAVALDGIPYHPDFPMAQYPYAQAPDGCSSWDEEHPEWIRDTYGPVDFTPACNKHDRCYYTYGSSWQRCNEEYFKDLTGACWDGLKICETLFGKEFCIVDPISLAICEAIAATYYVAVQTGVALDVFDEAQELQKKYDQWVASFYCLSGPVYVNSAYTGEEKGTLAQPFKSIQTAYDKACVRAEIKISPGTFSGKYTFDRPLILNAEYGIVVIGD